MLLIIYFFLILEFEEEHEHDKSLISPEKGIQKK